MKQEALTRLETKYDYCNGQTLLHSHLIGEGGRCIDSNITKYNNKNL